MRYGETDQMGVVHHSNYLRYFEVARLEWLTQLGVSYQAMEEEGVMMPSHNIKWLVDIFIRHHWTRHRFWWFDYNPFRNVFPINCSRNGD